MSFCSKCGTQVSDTSSFCEKCGSPVNTISSDSSMPVTDEANKAEISKKSRLVTFLLGFLIGSFGSHNFYLGRIKRALIQLSMTIGGFILYIAGFFTLVFALENQVFYNQIPIPQIICVLLGVLLIISCSIWTFVEWILALCGVLKDKNGLPVKKWTD